VLLLADLTVLAHLLFIVFVVLGGVLVWRWRWIAWLHVPTALWGATIELTGWTCPLTPLENRLRDAAGGGGYEGGFIDHLLTPVVYPPGLTRDVQLSLGAAVISLNVLVYSALALRRRAGTK
jgi:hypothetical protein